jgi:hypothetical protein
MKMETASGDSEHRICDQKARFCLVRKDLGFAAGFTFGDFDLRM